ncbi:truncated hemoglobin-like protein [Hyphomicrobium denitrificans ATCC 51888]|uniref:Truncated hemoglobin-like protein n=1 Tax=Hyphomicrobium denitrificans (strain ATCC 51888 / DSM 1869 / NCIMB 11706 / TK 0415) TaxID=582899 RepID=D8JUZ6_HYPDA|nr:group III truncated hemoglobin [Hyphomicrobium denitrificans]ADJ22812.1 truncated hemoglobin-like protein [Hyphomicrobium denitrificans ATCC 51888]
MSYHPPHPKAPGLSVGIDEVMVADLVNRFYAKVRQDELLGPVFNSRIEDWDEHLAKLSAFWSSVVLMTGRYKGQPMPAHVAISEISEEHFLRWLELFAETAKAVCPPEAAALFVDRSQRIAQSLRLAIAASKGIIA